MSMTEKEEPCRWSISFDVLPSVVDGSGPIVQGDEDSPGFSEKLSDHVALGGESLADVVIVERRDHFTLFAQEQLLVDVLAVASLAKKSFPFGENRRGFAGPRGDGFVKGVAVREGHLSVEEIEIVGA